MKPILNRAQSRQFDEQAIGPATVPSLVLMENAGRGAAEVIQLQYPECAQLLVLCGPGNNGGDGLVVARRFLTWGRAVRVWLSAPSTQFSGDALLQFEAYRGLGGQFDVHNGRQQFEAAVAESDVLVDGLFGTGLTRAITGELAELVDVLNCSGKPIVALDLPSGLDADRGVELGTCVRAAHTVSFAFAKLGHFATLAQQVVGRLHVVDIGVPSRLAAADEPAAHRVEASDIRQALLARGVVSHKGQAGHVLVVAGAAGTLGAARLSAHGALRSGAGVVTVATRSEVAPLLESTAWETMIRPLSTNSSEQSLSVLRELLGKANTVVFGPGLGTDHHAQAWARCVLDEFAGTVVLDADGLSLYAGRAKELRDTRATLVLTPHPGEASRLLSLSSAEVEEDRFGAALHLAQTTDSVVVLKGRR